VEVSSYTFKEFFTVLAKNRQLTYLNLTWNPVFVNQENDEMIKQVIEFI
jgi:hypothetical protein